MLFKAQGWDVLPSLVNIWISSLLFRSSGPSIEDMSRCSAFIGEHQVQLTSPQIWGSFYTTWGLFSAQKYIRLCTFYFASLSAFEVEVSKLFGQVRLKLTQVLCGRMASIRDVHGLLILLIKLVIVGFSDGVLGNLVCFFNCTGCINNRYFWC